jgi:hypothetical protein
MFTPVVLSNATVKTKHGFIANPQFELLQILQRFPPGGSYCRFCNNWVPRQSAFIKHAFSFYVLGDALFVQSTERRPSRLPSD